MNARFIIAPLSFAMIILIASLAFAQAPTSIPIQGLLADTDGKAITDSIPIKFTLYDGDDQSLFSETATIYVNNAAFSHQLGSVKELDFALFKTHTALEIGITIGTDAEMTPRLKLGSVPYSALSNHALAADFADVADFAHSAEKIDGMTGADIKNYVSDKAVLRGQANSITTPMITAGAVTSAQLAANAVTSTHITDGAITSTKLANAAVTSTHIATNAVTSTHIANNAVTSAKLANGAVTSTHIANNAVTTTQLADASVTSAKLKDRLGLYRILDPQCDEPLNSLTTNHRCNKRTSNVSSCPACSGNQIKMRYCDGACGCFFPICLPPNSCTTPPTTCDNTLLGYMLAP